MLHDYHLYIGAEVHPPARGPTCSSTTSSTSRGHSRTPGACCPRDMREDIYEGILSNDIIGFHTHPYRRNFLLCCRELFDLEVDEEAGVVHFDGPRGVGARLPAADLGRDASAAPRSARRCTTTSASSCGAGAST